MVILFNAQIKNAQIIWAEAINYYIFLGFNSFILRQTLQSGRYRLNWPVKRSLKKRVGHDLANHTVPLPANHLLRTALKREAVSSVRYARLVGGLACELR